MNPTAVKVWNLRVQIIFYCAQFVKQTLQQNQLVSDVTQRHAKICSILHALEIQDLLTMKNGTATLFNSRWIPVMKMTSAFVSKKLVMKIVYSVIAAEVGIIQHVSKFLRKLSCKPP